jgi:hypothetical protein
MFYSILALLPEIACTHNLRHVATFINTVVGWHHAYVICWLHFEISSVSYRLCLNMAYCIGGCWLNRAAGWELLTWHELMSHVHACALTVNDWHTRWRQCRTSAWNRSKAVAGEWRFKHMLYAWALYEYIQTPWSESTSELYRPSDRRLSAKWLPTFKDRGCHVVSLTDPYGRILGFLDRSRYFSIK